MNNPWSFNFGNVKEIDLTTFGPYSNTAGGGTASHSSCLVEKKKILNSSISFNILCCMLVGNFFHSLKFGEETPSGLCEKHFLTKKGF